MTIKKIRVKRKFVFGIGKNDVNYDAGESSATCPYYKKWMNIIKRCYSKNYQLEHPSYIGCSVCEEWLLFSNFKKWMESQDWQGKELDKDILKPGNKIYSPETCVFVEKELNSFLRKRKGKWPSGITFDSSRNKYIANCVIRGKNKNLGRFENKIDARKKYVIEKCKEIIRIASEQIDSRIKNGLILHAERLEKSQWA